MKIEKIERDPTDRKVFIVHFTPTFLEYLFGYKSKKSKFKDTGATYSFGGGKVYINKKGELLDNGNNIATAIDNFRRSW